MASQQPRPHQPEPGPAGNDPASDDPAGAEAVGGDAAATADAGGSDRVTADPARADGGRSGPAVAGSDLRWTVARAGWKSVAPGLSDEAAALLAAPVVVSAEWPAREGDGRRGEDDDEEEQPERYRTATGHCLRDLLGRRPGFLAPAGLRPLANARHRV